MPSIPNTFAARSNDTDRLLGSAVNTTFNTGWAWLDMMLNFQQQLQRASLQSFTSYSPAAGASITGRLVPGTDAERVVPVGEERLNVATRTVQGETTRVRHAWWSRPSSSR